MNTYEAISANCWHPLTRKAVYPTPQSVLRAAVGCPEYKFSSEMPSTDGIRAAAIMPLAVPFEHLLNVPWALVHYSEDWVMVMVSTLDVLKWVELARASGCLAYQVGHNKTVTFQWQPPVMDRHGNKVEPPGPVPLNKKFALKNPDAPRRQFKKYDHDAVLTDIKENVMNQHQIADKHGLSRMTVMKIAHRAGIRKNGDINGKTKSHNYT